MDVRQPWFVAGFLCGALGAAAAVLLATPMSGRAVRQAIADHFSRAREDAKAAGRDAEAEVLMRYRQIRGDTQSATLHMTPAEGPSSSAANRR